ncbi:polysaccharide deacetylase family protein [Lederbergia citrea]|uniref:polysaccharide deacetylase family protein n=1 Tax=Lederbergia citrea TaxID=2833581 RepID=UPI001BC90C6D|nr:polysaccharide deacetylase family protein [Lederbergia citrea]MBS4179138.1 DUF2334 domain-containing protein [Lederbergia citrea]
MIKLYGQYMKSLKKKYFQWRYWGYLYKSMVKHLDYCNKEINKEYIPYINKPGIVLSFDDSYRVHDWCKYGKETFGYYDIKVTFNINGVHPLEGNRKHTQKEIDQLLELQSNGHEIAHHGFKHKTPTEYTANDGYDKWIKDEIETLFNWMAKQSHSKTKEGFKRPVSFAFPHFIYNDISLRQIIPKYFKIARGHLHKDHLTGFKHNGFAPSICLDGYYSCNIYYLKKIIKLAKKSGKNLILTCHSILPEDASDNYYGNGENAAKWGTWKISPKIIQMIIDETRKNDMEFYTTSEIAGIATFIDHNLERAIKEQLSIPKEEWIEISKLYEVKELDLSNKGITNLDGLEYFLSLEKINLSNNEIADYRLLKKLPKLKDVIIEDKQTLGVKKRKEISLLAQLKSSCMLIGINIATFVESIPFN